MAVVMFMVDAMQQFKKMSPEKIKATALEIAMLGTQGINPAKGNNYKLSNIPNKDFSGFHLSAYYYVSWAIAIPEMLSETNLPYDNSGQKKVDWSCSFFFYLFNSRKFTVNYRNSS